MRIDTHKQLVKISAPLHVESSTIRAFLARNQNWLEQQVEKRPTTQVVQEGSLVPFRGAEYRVVIDPSVREIEAKADGDMVLPARGEPVLRLQRFLIAQASEDLRARADRLSAQLGIPFRSLRVRQDPLGQLFVQGGAEFLLAADFCRRRCTRIRCCARSRPPQAHGPQPGVLGAVRGAVSG